MRLLHWMNRICPTNHGAARVRMPAKHLSYERCYCIVKATLDYKGKRTQFFSEPILMDKCSLGVFLALHKSGIIYVNPRNKKDYFFDLDFLKQE